MAVPSNLTSHSFIKMINRRPFTDRFSHGHPHSIYLLKRAFFPHYRLPKSQYWATVLFPDGFHNIHTDGAPILTGNHPPKRPAAFFIKLIVIGHQVDLMETTCKGILPHKFQQVSCNSLVACEWFHIQGFHLDKDTTPFPRWLLLNRYSRRAG